MNGLPTKISKELAKLNERMLAAIVDKQTLAAFGAPILLAAPSPKPTSKTGGLGGFVPTKPNYTVLTPFQGSYKLLAGTGLAIMVLAGILGAIFGFIALSFSGDKEKSARHAHRIKIGIICAIAGLLLGGVILTIAAAATLFGG